MKTVFLKWLEDSTTLTAIAKSLLTLVETTRRQEEAIATNNKAIDETNSHFDRLTAAITNLTQAIMAMQKENRQQTELLMTLYVMYDELTVALGASPTQPKKDSVAIMLDGVKLKAVKGDGGKSN